MRREHGSHTHGFFSTKKAKRSIVQGRATFTESLFKPAFENAIGNAVENRFVENCSESHLQIICESLFMLAIEKAIGNAVENRFVENVVEIAFMNCNCGIRLEVSSCLPPGRDEAW